MCLCLCRRIILEVLKFKRKVTEYQPDFPVFCLSAGTPVFPEIKMLRHVDLQLNAIKIVFKNPWMILLLPSKVSQNSPTINLSTDEVVCPEKFLN